LEEEMAKPEVFSNFDKLQQIKLDFDRLAKELTLANEKWDHVAAAIDKINGDQ
jgi:ATP-binding cassette subfamily F protein 3